MHTVSQKALREFGRKHTDAAKPLGAWFKLARHGRFTNLAELKRIFASVDMVPLKRRDFFVFNIGGNKYRLIAAIHFNTQRLFVRQIMTHLEYGTGRWKR